MSEQVIIEETKQGRFTQQVTIGTHKLIADEPKDSGGLDAGPSPYDFLLASLGTCTAMTLRMYADFKKFNVEKIKVTLTIDKSYAKDCENCGNDSSKIDHITRSIEIKGQLTDEERQKLLAIANKCPVHRTLTSKLLISTDIH